MQNKNTVITLLIVFSLICVYHLYYTFQQFSIDGKINEAQSIIDNVSETSPSDMTFQDTLMLRENEEIVKDENLLDQRREASKRSFNLGLDLQGGMFVTLELGVEDLIRSLSSDPENQGMEDAISCASERSITEDVSFVSLFVDCYRNLEEQGKTTKDLSVLFAPEELSLDDEQQSDEDVVTYLEDAASSTINRTFTVLRKRIDQFGVSSPNMQIQEGTGRILLELPGVKEPERVRDLLRRTASLEFWVGGSIQDAIPVMYEVNDLMRLKLGVIDSAEYERDRAEREGTADADTAVVDSSAQLAVADSNQVDLAYADSADEILDSGLTTSELLDQNLDTGLTEEPTNRFSQEFRDKNPLFGYLNTAVPRYSANSPLIGIAHIKDTARINAILRDVEVAEIIRSTTLSSSDGSSEGQMRLMWTFQPTTRGEDETLTDSLELIVLKTNDLGEAEMSGDVVTRAYQDRDPQTGEVVVNMQMNSTGTEQWGSLTTREQGNFVAVVLDGMVYSYPRINEPITGGSTRISGSFDVEEAEDLANVLQAGQLEVAARIIGEETVGPTLGAENVNRGMLSFLGAFMVTLIFMGIYYARAGLVANVALLANLIFILGCSAAFNIVLTMSGIAAVVLTVGMAVDANVLIFERIREELAKDKTLKASIKSGFSNAFSSVMDANITTFLTGVVLYAVGVGPIRGFAVSLMIGIITSLISALIITRLILDYYANRGGQSINFGFDWTVGLFDKAKINMVGRRRFFYGVSGVLVTISLVSIILFGFRLGVDFQGGHQFKVEFSEQNDQPYFLQQSDLDQIRTDLTGSFGNRTPVIKTVSADNQLLITTDYLINDKSVTTDSIKGLLLTGLNQNYNSYKIEVPQVSKVGATVSDDIREAAIAAVALSLLIIFVYILIRFRKWQYSLGAVAAVFHDVIIVLGIFSLLGMIENLPFSVEIDQALIAALLTIIGYSINDTVVVFDRIRENFGEMKSSSIPEIYNTSIDQTISRTLITSLTTLLTILILFIFGGDVIRGFSFALLLGIIVGTYSSIFVASPISLDLQLRSEGKTEAVKA